MGAARRLAAPSAEGLDDAALRTLAETTGLAPRYIEQLYTFGAPDRSPDRARGLRRVLGARALRRGRSAPSPTRTCTGSTRTELPELAFDHREIIDYALWRLRTKLQYSRIAHALLGETFTMAELRGVHEAVLTPPPRPGELPPHHGGATARSSTPAQRLSGHPAPPARASTASTRRRPRGIRPTSHHRTAEDEPMTIAPPARTAGARVRGIRRPHHPPDHKGRDVGRHLLARARQGPVELRSRPLRLRTRLVGWAT